MNVTTTDDGESAVVRLAGRLDGAAAQELADLLDRLLREGQRSVFLDMAAVRYLSTPGVQVLQRAQQEYASLRGELRVVSPTADVLEVLSLADLAPGIVATGLPRASRPLTMSPTMEFTRDSWRVAGAPSSRAGWEVSPRELGPGLECRLFGDPEAPARGWLSRPDYHLVEFPQNAFGVGVGALARTVDDASPRLGEVVAASGVVAHLPTEGVQVPDFEIGTERRVGGGLFISGFICSGIFTHLARFTAQHETPVSLAEVARVCLETVGGHTAGVVMLAEVSALVGAWLRQSPGATLGKAQLRLQGMSDWLATTPEPVHQGTTAMVVGIVSRQPGQSLAAHLRPISDDGLAGHFHAAVFSYRPVPQRTVVLRTLVTRMFTQQRLRAVLHLLRDDRGPVGAGESRFARGLC
ncbi:MAG: STAS domain-containing protein, partial [Gemmatimonadales bacterium]